VEEDNCGKNVFYAIQSALLITLNFLLLKL